MVKNIPSITAMLSPTLCYIHPLLEIPAGIPGTSLSWCLPLCTQFPLPVISGTALQHKPQNSSAVIHPQQMILEWYKKFPSRQSRLSGSSLQHVKQLLHQEHNWWNVNICHLHLDTTYQCGLFPTGLRFLNCEQHLAKLGWRRRNLFGWGRKCGRLKMRMQTVSCRKLTTCCHTFHGQEISMGLTTMNCYTCLLHMRAINGWLPPMKTKSWISYDGTCCFEAQGLKLPVWPSLMWFVLPMINVTWQKPSFWLDLRYWEGISGRTMR